MSGECDKCSEHTLECNCNRYRYVCPNCLRTFLDYVYDENRFCWKCGEGLEVIPKNEV
jgi:hypothetical protein